jgi:hypothetical protein
MQASDRSFAEFEARLASRERRALARTIVLTLIPVIAAVVFLWITVDEVRESERKLDQVNKELATAERERDRAVKERDLARRQTNTLRGALGEVQQQLRKSSDFATHIYPFDWSDVKLLASQSPDLARLLVTIRARRGIPFDLANRPDKGFSSPGFAAFVLQELGRLPRDVDGSEALSRLPSSRRPPVPGDIVRYETGYAMFYFRDRNGRPFVVGMTPVGIAALRPNFGPKRTEVLRTGLSP